MNYIWDIIGCYIRNKESTLGINKKKYNESLPFTYTNLLFHTETTTDITCNSNIYFPPVYSIIPYWNKQPWGLSCVTLATLLMPIFAQSEIRAKLRCAKMNLREFGDARIALNSKPLKNLKVVSPDQLDNYNFYK